MKSLRKIIREEIGKSEIVMNSSYFKERIPFLKSYEENQVLGKEDEVRLFKKIESADHIIRFKNGEEVQCPTVHLTSDFSFTKYADSDANGHSLIINNRMGFSLPDSITGKQYDKLAKIRDYSSKYSRSYFCKTTDGKPDPSDLNFIISQFNKTLLEFEDFSERLGIKFF